MFTGSKHVRAGLPTSCSRRPGVSDSNATTSFDRTNYFETVPSNQLELALWTHADRMGYLLDSLDQTALSNQQDVVRNERRQTHREPGPTASSTKRCSMRCFRRDIRIGPHIIGSHVDIQAARIERRARFLQALLPTEQRDAGDRRRFRRRAPQSVWCKSSSARSSAVPTLRARRSSRRRSRPSNA